MCHSFVTIFLLHPFQHPAAPVIVEVGINIGQRNAVGIQETLKQQVIFQRVYLSDAQAVGYHRTGCGATTGSHQHVQLIARRIDKVLNDEEVAWESHGLHHVQLKVDALFHLVAQRLSIEFLGSVVSQFPQIFRFELDAVDAVIASEVCDTLFTLFRRQLILSVFVACKLVIELFFGISPADILFRSEFLRYREERHDGVMVQAIDFHLVKNLHRVCQSFRNIRENLAHFLPCLQPLLLTVQHSGWVVQVFCRRQAEQMVVGFGVFPVHEMGIVRTNQLDAILFCQFYQHFIRLLLQGEGLPVGTDVGIGHFMPLEFQIIVFAKDTAIPFDGLTSSRNIILQNLMGHLAGNTCRADNQSFMVALQVLPVGPGTHVEAIHPCPADQLNQVFISRQVLCQDNQVVTANVAFRVFLFLIAISRHVHFTADDRLEGLLPFFYQLLIDLFTIV